MSGSAGRIERLLAENAGLREQLRATELAGGDGGPHVPTMEQRVARLEDDVKDVKADIRTVKTDLAAIRADLGYLKGRLENLPTTWVMVTTLLGSQAALLAFSFMLLRYMAVK